MTRGRALGPGRLWRRGHSWILDWRDAQGRRRHRVVACDRRTAERIRAELIQRRDLELAGLGSEAGQALPLCEVVEAYLADLGPRVVERHLQQVRSRLAKVLERLPGVRVRDLCVPDVVRLRGEIVAAGHGNRAANLLADNLRACLCWAVEAGLVAANPLQHVKRLPDGDGYARRPRRALAEDEVQRLLAAVAEDDRRCAGRYEVDGRVRVPQAPWLATLVETGMRYGEARQLAWGDVDLKERLLVVRAETAKARRQRVIPMRRELAEELRALKVLHERVLGRLPGSGDCVFLAPEGVPHKRPTTNASRILHRVMRRAGILRRDGQGRSVDLHALRATCGTRLARAGVGLAQAQRLLGHSDPKLTARHYTLLGVEDLRAAVEAVGIYARAAAVAR